MSTVIQYPAQIDAFSLLPFAETRPSEVLRVTRAAEPAFSRLRLSLSESVVGWKQIVARWINALFSHSLMSYLIPILLTVQAISMLMAQHTQSMQAPVPSTYPLC